MADGTLAEFEASKVVPPLKWAGGKRWLVDRLVSALPGTFSRLIEPFVGSAAMFFRLNPSSAVLSDTNAELINLYRCLQANPEKLYNELAVHAPLHSKEYYYKIRADVPRERIARAARILYLNRTCWNALYRVNKRGEFNVPIGTKQNVLLATDDFLACSALLQRASLLTGDFSKAISLARAGDLVFADPPYFSRSQTGTFVKYTNPTFTWADQERLARSLLRARGRGAHFVLTNVDAPDLAQLYTRDGYITRISRQTVISGKTTGRGATSELIWTSFPLSL